ncbi:MAG: DUF5017 domain-containing protein [Paludibacter sp.]|nr:DUF5017 domain-containing protein [Paludibacter sp.]
MKKMILILLAAIALFSCNDIAVDMPNDFNISPVLPTTIGDTLKGDTLVIKKGDVLVYNITGNPDFITFYSGEKHFNYNYVGLAHRDADSSIVAFSTKLSSGTLGKLTVYASNNYSGNFTDVNNFIDNTKSVDITSKFKFSTTTAAQASGNLRLDSVTGIDKSKPVYVAFRFKSDTIKTTDKPQKWIISAFSLKNCFADTTYVNANDMRSAGFTTKSLSSPSNYWYFENAQMTFLLNAVGLNTPGEDDWIVSRAFDLGCVWPDGGLIVKTPNNTGIVTTYSYQYTKTGIFVSTFLAKNQAYTTSKQVARKKIIKVIP